MNNLRLLAGCALSILLSGGACAYGQSVVTLEEIYQSAEANSARLRPYVTAEAEAVKEISVAKAGRLPDIDASLSLSFIGDGFTTKRDFTDYQKAPIPHLGTGLAVGVTQPLYTGGAITGSIELAELKSTAARFATDLQRDNIRFELTGFYLDIYKFTNLREVVESNLTSARKVLAEMQARYEQGTALQNDITRYELLVSNLELQIIRIDNTLEILNNNLVTVAGLPKETKVIPDSTILLRSLPLQGEEWWQAEARSNSPSLKLARSGVDISRKAEDLVKAERLPKVGLQAGWTMDGPILVEIPPINRNLSYWYVGLGVSYNVASLYKTNRSIDKSRLSTRKAAEQLAAADEGVSMAVRADHVRYLEAYQQLKTQQKSVELAERNYNTVATRYSEGMALITDMLDAADSRLGAQQKLIDARIDIIYYYYKLLFTSGKI
ncbi:MAG: TolC family protein [Muribaculaceae bacterium]|nr:TolC family protein [Muribaculaceae bacterium]